MPNYNFAKYLTVFLKIEKCYKNTPYTPLIHPTSHMGWDPHYMGPTPCERMGV
jgi:hypothetical protein